MPTTFPIKIHAILDSTTEASVLSKYSFNTRLHTNDNFSYLPFTNKSTWTQIKGTTFHEFSGLSNTQIYENVISADMFQEPDIVLTYYNKNEALLNNCSFSLYDTPIADRYDFVTIVLRDIAKSLGLHWNIKSNGSAFRINYNTIIPYEKSIIGKIYSDDNSQMFKNALKGSVVIGDDINWSVYAPTTWNPILSLNYFIPNEYQKITQLLSYEFGKGSVVRDIASDDTYCIFKDILRWKGDIIVGAGGIGYSSKNTNTENVIPYNGTISITNNTNRNYKRNEAEDSLPHSAVYGVSSENFDNISSIINKYHPYYNSGSITANEGWHVSLLLKDGSWDNVFAYPFHTYPYTISTTEFQLNYPIDSYARSCDGYLRCRVNEGYYNPNYGKVTGMSHYYLIDYLPQNVKMKMAKMLNCEDETDYYRDVKIALRDLEGVTKIVVSQLDEGNDVPYSYEIEDFKKGYFTTTVDRDSKSTFTIYSYNKNGKTTCTPYVLQPVDPTPFQLQFKYKEDKITIELVSNRTGIRNFIASYRIARTDLVTPVITELRTQTLPERFIPDSNVIDVSSLSPGFYVLGVIDVRGGTHTFQFLKR